MERSKKQLQKCPSFLSLRMWSLHTQNVKGLQEAAQLSGWWLAVDLNLQLQGFWPKASSDPVVTAVVATAIFHWHLQKAHMQTLSTSTSQVYWLQMETL